MPLELVLCKRIYVLHSVYFSNLPENSNVHHFSTGAKSDMLLPPCIIAVLVENFSSTGISNGFLARHTLLVVQFTVLLAQFDMTKVI